ncbi:MAG: CDP-alcohol phosphatidyltransferase family protein [Lentisphaerae bacterium]|nr:CDP-alcohol phosphatidyltransferase family protein [Lentisphaerota bacterium]
MTWRQLLPTSITLGAMLCGFFSILFALEGSELFLASAQCIMLAMILDGIDGNVARRIKGMSEFGAELDTYVDMTAFGLAPAVLIYQVSLQSHVDWRVLMTAMVVLSGVIRLARFKVHDPDRGQAGYCGLPITTSAGWVAMFVMLSENSRVGPRFSLNQGPIAFIFLAGVTIMILLQVSNVRYPKPTKTMFAFIPCVLLVAMLFYPPKSPGSDGVRRIAELIMIVLGVLYVVLGPLFVKISKGKKPNEEPNLEPQAPPAES